MTISTEQTVTVVNTRTTEKGVAALLSLPITACLARWFLSFSVLLHAIEITYKNRGVFCCEIRREHADLSEIH